MVIHIKEPSTSEEKEWVKERGEGVYQVVLVAEQNKDLGNGIVLSASS